MTDAELVQRTLAGDQAAYADLVRAYQARVLRLCASLLRDDALAEDAAQEIFLKAYQALASFRGRSAFSTWLYRIAANHCLDLLRRRRRERTESWEALVEASGDHLERLLQGGPDPATAAADADLVRRALAQLPPDYQLILTLREVEGLSYEELAETLHCSLDAVKARLRRARQDMLDRLRHFLGPARVKKTGATP